MYTIKKAKENISSAERVIRTFYYEPVDRIPIDYMANPGIQKKLCHALSIPVSDEESLLRALGVDYREIKIPYCGKQYFRNIEGLNVDPIYGFYTRWIENNAGGYEDFAHFPLKDASEEVIYNYPLPSPDEFDYTTVLERCFGSSSWAYEDFIEIGVKGVDTLQPEAVNMSPEYLKEKFHGRLSFHGCISTAGVLAYGTPAQVAAQCSAVIRKMGEGGGYQFAPTHMIQDNTPVENIIAMYQTAHTCPIA